MNYYLLGSLLGGYAQQLSAQNAYQNAMTNSYNSQQSALGLAGLQSAATDNVVPIREPEPTTLRTPEEIREQLEARYAELEQQAERQKWLNEFSCAKCRWGDRFESAWCHQPLVKGFGDRVRMGGGSEPKRYIPALCGPEKALWEPEQPKQAWYAKLWNWFLAPWRK